MALQKSFTTTYMVPAAYWKVGQVKVDWHTEQCTANLIGFVNQQARTDGGTPLATKTYSWKGEAFDFDIEGKLVQQIYTKVKALEEWSGASDV